MDEEKIKLQYNKKIYIYKILYLVRTNLPSSEFIYIIMFFIKYLGLIITSISLNELESGPSNSVNIDKDVIKENEEPRILNDSNKPDKSPQIFITNFKKILSNLLITGTNLKILQNNYQQICLFGFILLMIYIILIILCFIYMGNKYNDESIKTKIDKKLLKVNNSSIWEKKFIKIMTYIFFLISFFNQYIMEYYFFGFFGHILNLVGLYDSDSSSNIFNQVYLQYIREYIINMKYNQIFILIINFVIMIIIYIVFILFMMLNSTKSLFINIGNPFFGDARFIFTRIIIFNYNEICGYINMFSSDLLQTIVLFLLSLSIIIIALNIAFSYYISFYPSNLSTMCIFIDFFCFFSIVSELIILITDSNINSTKFKLAKLFIIFLNSLILSTFYVDKKEKYYLKFFSMNIFSENFNSFKVGDIYYYMKTYLKNEKNENNNYMKIFRIIQKHILIKRIF